MKTVVICYIDKEEVTYYNMKVQLKNEHVFIMKDDFYEHLIPLRNVFEIIITDQGEDIVES